MEFDQSLILKNLTDLYKQALTTSDPRTKDYLLVWNDPIPVLQILLAYLLIVTIGRRVMSYLPAVPVPVSFLFAYNFFLVILSAYMVEEIISGVLEAKYDLICAKYDRSRSSGEMRVVNALWWYFFSKAIELLDTVLMVLRKKNVQITFLHVFHHSSMLVIWWIVISWIPSGQAYFGAALNSLVHIFMYSYYALSVIPSLKDKLWWKKYITTIQLVQFVITFTHTSLGLYKTCDFPLWGQLLLFFYMIIMMILFSNFYIHEYVKKTNDAKKRKSTKDINNNDVNGKLHKSKKSN